MFTRNRRLMLALRLHEETRRQAKAIMMNVNKLPEHVAHWHAYEGGSDLLTLMNIVSYHKKHAVARILTEVVGDEPTANEWNRFLNNRN